MTNYNNQNQQDQQNQNNKQNKRQNNGQNDGIQNNTSDQDATQNFDKRAFLENLKQETAQEMNIDLSKRNLTAREAGQVGGNMVHKMIEQVKKGQ